jgi:glycosyltransferase involved in cell wall biosynthesis
VLTIAHNAVAASNRARFDALARLPDLDMTLLTPRWWFEEGRRIDVAHSTAWRVGHTLFTSNGTRHVYMSGLLEAIRATRPDVIDLFEEPFSLVALQTLLLRDLLAPRAALVFYSAVNVERRWRLPYRQIERLVLRRADGAHAPNADAPKILRAKGFSRQPVSVIPLGVDVERFSSAEPLGLPEVEKPRVGFVGRLEAVKGLDVLLDAFQLLTTAASMVIAGEGSERARLVGRISSTDSTRPSDSRTHTAAHRTHFLPPVTYDEMPAFLKALAVVVLPSVTMLPLHREQFGRVLVEAMAAGVPVVGSSSGAIPEVIGDAGLVVPERDPLALAAAIDRLLTDAELRRTMVARGRLRVERRFAWPVVADQTLELFRSAVAHRRRAAARMQAIRA